MVVRKTATKDKRHKWLSPSVSIWIQASLAVLNAWDGQFISFLVSTQAAKAWDNLHRIGLKKAEKYWQIAVTIRLIVHVMSDP